MKPVYTIHAGEYFVGSHIEKIRSKWHIWIPSKDTGVDLLLSNSKNSKTVSIQVKSSKDYSPDFNNPVHQRKLVGSSYFNLNTAKLSNSQAELWVFVIHSFKLNKYHYVIIKPKDLSKRFKRIHNVNQNIRSYLWITKGKECWETRGLKKAQQEAILNNDTNEIDENRNFSQFLNNWESLEEKLGL